MSGTDLARADIHRELEEFESANVQIHQEYRRCTRRLVVGYGMAIAVNLLAMVVTKRLTGQAELPLYARFGLLMGTLMVFVAPPATSLEAARKRIDQLFSTAASPAVVGALLRHGCIPGSLRKSARVGLKRILPQVRADHAPLVDNVAMHGLLSLLANPRDPEVTIAVLKALEQIGDSRAIPAVRRLTFPHEWPVGAYRSSRHMDRIVVAAIACLPYLERRAAVEQLGAGLLRPSSHDTESLLRPTVGTSVEPESQLLRAANIEVGESSTERP